MTKGKQPRIATIIAGLVLLAVAACDSVQLVGLQLDATLVAIAVLLIAGMAILGSAIASWCPPRPPQG